MNNRREEGEGKKETIRARFLVTPLADNHNCVQVRLMGAKFDSARIYLTLDVVHPVFRTHFHFVVAYTYHPLWCTDDDLHNIVGALQLVTIEEGKTIQVKFMDSEIRHRDYIEALARFFHNRFEVVRDSEIFMEIRNKTKVLAAGKDKKEKKDNDTGE